MRRALLTASLLCLFEAVASPANAASLTRIETRPFYGAIVTIEEGVRVFRPLPPERHIIINPDGKTPLNLTFEEHNVVVHHHHQYSVAPDDERGYVSGGYGGFYPGFRGRRHHRHHSHRHRHRSGGYLIRAPRASGRR